MSVCREEGARLRKVGQGRGQSLLLLLLPLALLGSGGGGGGRASPLRELLGPGRRGLPECGKEERIRREKGRQSECGCCQGSRGQASLGGRVKRVWPPLPPPTPVEHGLACLLPRGKESQTERQG